MHHNTIISKQIITTVTQRGPEKSTCPSEIARMLFADNWRDYMQQVSDVAIDITSRMFIRDELLAWPPQGFADVISGLIKGTSTGFIQS